MLTVPNGSGEPESPSRMRMALRSGSFRTNDSENPESPSPSPRASPRGGLREQPINRTPHGESMGFDQQTNRLERVIKTLKADRLSRSDGLLSGSIKVHDPKLTVKEEIREWMHVEDPKSGESWFLNKDTRRIEFDRPTCLENAQESADRVTAIHILKNIKPEFRNDAHILLLKRLLKDNTFMMGFGPDTLTECCRIMKYRSVHQSAAVCFAGDEADNFYMLLRGSVGVWIKLPGEDNDPEWRKIDPETGGPGCSKRVVVLGEGKSFGEQGLMYDEKRNASIITLSPCEFAVIEKPGFNKVLKGHFLRMARCRIEFLERSLPVLLGDQQIPYEYIEGFFKEIPVDNGEILISTGDEPEHLDIIAEGTCNVFWHEKKEDGEKSSPDGMKLGELSAGKIIGSTMCLHVPQTYEVVCATRVKVLRILKDDVFSRLSQALVDELAKLESDRVEQFMDRARRAKMHDAFEGLARGLTRRMDKNTS